MLITNIKKNNVLLLFNLIHVCFMTGYIEEKNIYMIILNSNFSFVYCIKITFIKIFLLDLFLKEGNF